MLSKYYVNGKNKSQFINTFSLNVLTIHLCDKITS